MIDRDVSPEELAARTGQRPAQVREALAYLKQAGYLTRHGNRITLHQPGTRPDKRRQPPAEKTPRCRPRTPAVEPDASAS